MHKFTRNPGGIKSLVDILPLILSIIQKSEPRLSYDIVVDNALAPSGAERSDDPFYPTLQLRRSVASVHSLVKRGLRFKLHFRCERTRIPLSSETQLRFANIGRVYNQNATRDDPSWRELWQDDADEIGESLYFYCFFFFFFSFAKQIRLSDLCR